MERLRILFVVSHRFQVIGGHLLSAISLARELQARGHEVGLMVDPIELHDLQGAGFMLHFAPYSDSLAGRLVRSAAIYRVVRQYGYRTLVAMDARAALQAMPAALRCALQLVQVKPGGLVPELPPLRLPGLVVFSEELLRGMQTRHRVPASEMILAMGRVDFDWFQRQARVAPAAERLGFADTGPRLLAISRLAAGKAPAIKALLEQVERAGHGRPLQLRVIGEGEARAALESRAKQAVRATGGSADIRFLGGFRVEPGDLREASLVIGQGRTVLEALACGVPAAVCGNNGYHGLLTPNSLPALASTNLTGRSLQAAGDLLADLAHVDTAGPELLREVSALARNMYGVERGADAIEATVHLIEQRFGGQTPRRALLRACAAHLAATAEYGVRRIAGRPAGRATTEGTVKFA